MKKLVLLFVLSLSTGAVLAENLLQFNNPFPQTSPQKFNNIYESEPAIIQKEAKQEKKSWFRKGKNLQEQETKEVKSGLNTYNVNGVNGVNEGAQENGFYVFK